MFIYLYAYSYVYLYRSCVVQPLKEWNVLLSAVKYAMKFENSNGAVQNELQSLFWRQIWKKNVAN